MSTIKIKLKEIIKNSEVYDLSITSSDRKHIKEVDDWLFKILPRNSIYSITYYSDNKLICVDANISIRSKEFIAHAEGSNVEKASTNLTSEIKKALYM